ncbi:hypothetical protein [Burkholderia pseudomallei]|uniref:hypothetical protein n=1 Tax=Burkholderia pseudomallei TaxID=28450 RepID=UPI001E5CD4B2|nr:hypothetical protein [Burkholderia pseudomallei]
MRRKAVDNFELHRWRALSAAEALSAIADYAKIDASFKTGEIGYVNAMARDRRRPPF